MLEGAHNTVGPGQAVALIANRDRGYFLFYRMLPHELWGAAAAALQFTEAQLDRFAEEHAGDRLQGDFTFGDLYRKRVRSVLVPLQNYAFKRWHFGRIICLGDTVHKVCFLPPPSDMENPQGSCGRRFGTRAGERLTQDSHA